MFETIGIGVLVGIIWSAVGYAVSKAKSDEAFDPLKFVKTLIIGIILSSASQGLGVDIATLEGMSTIGFLTAIVDKVSGLFIKKK